MAENSTMLFSGFELVNGTKEGFDISSLNDLGKVYFIRTDSDGNNGYIYFNGKKYGVINGLDCGEY